MFRMFCCTRYAQRWSVDCDIPFHNLVTVFLMSSFVKHPAASHPLSKKGLSAASAMLVSGDFPTWKWTPPSNSSPSRVCCSLAVCAVALSSWMERGVFGISRCALRTIFLSIGASTLAVTPPFFLPFIQLSRMCFVIFVHV